jgi:murein DD-endopeptidase MepM/ murein hydrolase activator NlpD
MQGFGQTRRYYGQTCGSGSQWHNGIDYSSRGGSGPGANIMPAADGEVTVASYGYNGGWGNYVKIKLYMLK